MRYEIWSKFKIQVTYKLITRFEIKVLAKDDNIHYLGKHDQCKEGKNRIGATQYQGVDSKEGVTVSKHLNLNEKVKSQEKEAT